MTKAKDYARMGIQGTPAIFIFIFYLLTGTYETAPGFHSLVLSVPCHPWTLVVATLMYHTWPVSR